MLWSEIRKIVLAKCQGNSFQLQTSYPFHFWRVHRHPQYKILWIRQRWQQLLQKLQSVTTEATVASEATEASVATVATVASEATVAKETSVAKEATAATKATEAAVATEASRYRSCSAYRS